MALIWRWTGDNAFRNQLYGFANRGMHYIVNRLDTHNDGWPEGLGNVERPGMGEEKLDNTVYTIRGLSDLADMARSKGDSATASWASSVARPMQRKFEKSWWFGQDGARQYADSLDDPGNVKVFQRHWIGVTPMDAMLPGPEQSSRPLASRKHGTVALRQRQRPCYTGAGSGSTTPGQGPHPTRGETQARPVTP